MGKLIYFWLFCWLGCSFSIAQNLCVNYEASIKPNRNDSIKDNLIFSLWIDTQKQTSVFAFNDSLTQQPKQDLLLDTYSDQVFKNHQAALFTLFQQINKVYYKVPFSAMQGWKLLPETKEIKGYLCKKAEIHFAGRDYITWFTDEIPIPDGPYKFGGLPGLILEITSKDGDYHYTVSEIIHKKGNIPPALPKSIRINHEQLLQLKKNIIKNPSIGLAQKIAQAKSNNQSFSITYNGKNIDENDLLKSYEEEYRKFLNQYNNPIEKEDLWVK